MLEKLVLVVGGPLGLWGLAGLTKKLIRKAWTLEDWCLGPDSALGALTACLFLLLDIRNPGAASASPDTNKTGGVDSTNVATLAAFAIFTLIVLFLLLATHQTFADSLTKTQSSVDVNGPSINSKADRTMQRTRAIWIVFVFGNLVGMSLLGVLIVLKGYRI